MSRRNSGYLLLPSRRIVVPAAALLVAGAFFGLRQSPAPVAAVAPLEEARQGRAEATENTDRTATADVLLGHYSLGAGADRTALSLSGSGTFTMSSRALFGNNRKVYGQWRVDGTQVVLWYNNKGRLHRWALEPITTGDSFDLVPEELVEIYRENPRNIGVRYRRVSSLAASEVAVPAERVNASDTPRSIDIARSVPKPTPKSARATVSPTRIEKIVAAPPQRQERSTDEAPVPPAGSGAAALTSFVYKPAPHTPLDMALLHGPGLARLKINERGDVTEVTMLQSTGHRVSDVEAVETFRRWKAKPGAAREVDLPLAWAISGKRIPRQIGHIRSG